MDIENLILNALKKKRLLKASEIVKRTGFSRAYVNKFFQKLRNEKKIILLGKANKARYILATKEGLRQAKNGILKVTRMLQNRGLSEDIVLRDIKEKTGIFLGLPENLSDILGYAFSEMLNNAIEHSRSSDIRITMQKDRENITFHVIDKGVGIFNNIMQKKNLHNEMEAIQDLLKGKETTAPEIHSGEGIFFTSKAADTLMIQSSHKKLFFNNLVRDIFIKDIKNTLGTKITFSIGMASKKRLDNIFKQYTDESFEFSKTEVNVRLYKTGTEYISRSQARRILSGLSKFKRVLLDFRGVKTVGQGFADEIFRVWKSQHPGVSITVQNANENIQFMLQRADASFKKK
ncbi:MAG: DUF4325 domain-containing protein [Candidatus Omnitrophota bacterium]